MSGGSGERNCEEWKLLSRGLCTWFGREWRTESPGQGQTEELFVRQGDEEEVDMSVIQGK